MAALAMSTDLYSYKFKVTKRRGRCPVDTVCDDLDLDWRDHADVRAVTKAAEAKPAKQNGHTLFDKLPIEMNQRIAEHIENDDDIVSFCNACTATSNAVESDNMSFWRRRFLATFEKPYSVTSNTDFKSLYLLRKDVLKNGVGRDGFTIGVDPKEKYCLAVMRQMLVEAFSEKDASNALTYESKNLAFVLSIAKSHGLFQAIFNHKHHSKREQHRHDHKLLRLQEIIQIMLAPCVLSFDIEPFVYRFPESQEAVYSTATVNPIFNGAKVNFQFILHNLNFWRYHMVRYEEMSLEPVYRALTDSERPQFWSQPLSNGNQQEIGKYWKGAYAYVDHEDIGYIRAGLGDCTQYQDEFCGAEVGSAFQDLELQLDLNGVDGWSKIFEEHLGSLKQPRTTPTAKTRAQKESTVPDDRLSTLPRSFRFGGEGSDDTETFTADGWLNPLPEQEGIPGWRRMTMMKYYQDPETKVIDYAALWAYEGVVLPGGQMMIGRWWSPHIGESEEMYSGPFLLWCVDGAFEKQKGQMSVEP